MTTVLLVLIAMATTVTAIVASLAWADVLASRARVRHRAEACEQPPATPTTPPATQPPTETVDLPGLFR